MSNADTSDICEHCHSQDVCDFSQKNVTRITFMSEMRACTRQFTSEILR